MSDVNYIVSAQCENCAKKGRKCVVYTTGDVHSNNVTFTICEDCLKRQIEMLNRIHKFKVVTLADLV